MPSLAAVKPALRRQRVCAPQPAAVLGSGGEFVGEPSYPRPCGCPGAQWVSKGVARCIGKGAKDANLAVVNALSPSLAIAFGSEASG
jgi:hypothetical protein